MIEDRRIQTTTRVVIDDNGVVVLLGYQYYHIDTQTRYVVRIDPHQEHGDSHVIIIYKLLTKKNNVLSGQPMADVV